MKKIIILTFAVMFLGVSQAACKLENTGHGFTTGAACTIEDANATNEKAAPVKQESQKIKTEKIKDKKKMQNRLNYEFDRGLLYRNVNILWFNT